MNTLDAVRLYQSVGWTVVPVRFRSKSPISDKWQEAPPADTILKVYETRTELNVGVYLGARSGGLVDIDLDCQEAVNAAEAFLPRTVTYGRPSNPRSHWLYKVPGSEPEYRMFKSPGGSILEIRTSNPGGKQSVFPPSTHESGESIAFTEPFFPDALTSITADNLIKAVSRLAAFVVVVRHWPEQGTGQRHSATMALAGALVRAGLQDDEVLQFVSTLCRMMDEEDPADRMRAVRDTLKKARAGRNKKLVGFTTLAEFIGEEAKDALISCLFGDDDGSGYFDQFNKEWHFVRTDGDIVIVHQAPDPISGRNALAYYSTGSFKEALAAHYTTVGTGDSKKSVNAAQYWLRTAGIKKEYYKMACIPNGPVPPEVFNTWLGWSVDPAPGDWSPFKDHVFRVLANGNQEHFDWIMAFLADAVQNPANKPAVALVLQGKEGTGKTKFGDIVCSLCEEHATAVDNVEHLVGRFNGHLQDKLFVLANEAFYAGDKVHESRIRTFVSEKYTNIERKGVNAIKMPSMSRLIMTSNADWTVSASRHDRRFAVFRVSDERMNDRAYFAALDEHMYKKGGREALLHHLMTLDYDKSFATKIPKTEARADQQNLSRSDVESWWLERLTIGNPCPAASQSWHKRGRNGVATWPEYAAKEEMFDEFKDQYPSRYMKDTTFWLEMRKMLPPDTETRVIQRIEREVLNIDRTTKTVKDRAVFMKMPCLVDARAAYEQWCGYKIDWPELTDEPSEPAKPAEY